MSSKVGLGWFLLALFRFLLAMSGVPGAMMAMFENCGCPMFKHQHHGSANVDSFAHGSSTGVTA